MEAFDAPKPQHDETEMAWPPGMPNGADEHEPVAEPVAHEEPAPAAESWPPGFREPEAEPEAEAETSEAETPAAEAESSPVAEVDAAEELSEGEVLEPHGVDLAEVEPEREEWEPVDNDDDHEPTLVGAEAVAAAADTSEPASRRRLPSLPGLSRVRGANVSLSVPTFEPRVVVLVALLAVVGASGLLVMRSRSSDGTSASSKPVAATKNATPAAPATPATPATPAKPTTPAGFTHLVVKGGGYAVDVPTALTRTVNGSLVTFSSGDRGRAYALNGKSSSSDNLSAVARRIVAGYRDDYRLSSVKVSRISGGDVRVTASGRRRGGRSRQDILALVFRATDGKGTYVLQRFTPHGTTAPQDELNAVRDSVAPTG